MKTSLGQERLLRSRNGRTQRVVVTDMQPAEASWLIRHRNHLQDCLFLSLVVVLSFAVFIRSLGFYLDDWGFLGVMSTSKDQSLFGVTHTLVSQDIEIRQRPIQALCLAALYQAFGIRPLGYHLVATAVLLCSTLLLYLVLRKLDQPRLLALTVPLVYALLPDYSTDRIVVWCIPFVLSVVLYFLSLYADLMTLQSKLPRLSGWKLLSIASLFGSGLAYEVVLPLFLLNPLLLWYRARQIRGRVGGMQLVWRNVGVLIGTNLVALALVVAFKALITIRAGVHGSYAHHVAYLITASSKVSFGVYGLGLPYVAGWIVHNRPDWTSEAAGVLIGLLVFGYLYQLTRQQQLGLLGRGGWVRLISIGLVTFALGYSIFLTTDQVDFTTAANGNRIAIAGTIGVATIFVGVLGWATTQGRGKPARRVTFGALIALVCLCSFLITDAIATYWAAAYSRQQAVLAGIQKQVHVLSPGSVVLLDGVCPEVGPAPVFAADWDLAGALTIFHHDESIRANVIGGALRVGARGLSIERSGERDYYAYGRRLLLYNFALRRVYRLANVGVANHYFRTSGPKHHCAERAFNWGLQDWP